MAKKCTKKRGFSPVAGEKAPKPTKNRWPRRARTSYTSFEQKFRGQKSNAPPLTTDIEGQKVSKVQKNDPPKSNKIFPCRAPDTKPREKTTHPLEAHIKHLL